MPRIDRTIESLRDGVASARHAGRTIGFVPTMGALHAGHASLIDRARRDCGLVVVSIFVNPLQFDQPDDLLRYPRPFADDVQLCERLGVDVVFAPPEEVMYPSRGGCTVDPGRVADHCCGKYRPGHFAGVATVVTKLLNIVEADAAYFGEKDAQQLALIRRLVADLNLPVTIVGVPTVREADGLAMSSRNVRLHPAGRRAAPVLYAALREAAQAIAGGAADVNQLKDAAATRIGAVDGVRLEYFEIVDPDWFQPVTRATGPVVVAGAIWVGSTRLIDNIMVAG